MVKSNAIVSPYLRSVLHPAGFKKVINALFEELKPFKRKFDTIVFTGSSGCMIGPALATKLDKQMLLVRKECDGSHSSYLCEGYYELVNYVIVDDLVCTGRTIERLVKQVSDNCDIKTQRKNTLPTKCVGVITYYDPDEGVSYKPGASKYTKVKDILKHEDFFLKGVMGKILPV